MNKGIYLLYGFILSLLTFFSYLFIDQNFFYLKRLYTGFAFTNRQEVTYIYILFVLILFGFYKLFLKRPKSKLPIVIAVFILFLSYPAMLSADIFNYATTAKVLFRYHENPYLVMPIEFIGDSNLLFTQATNKIALYGPLWIILSGAPYLLGFGNFLLTLLNFKLLVITFYLATLWLIKKITQNNYSLVLFALNPLVVIEILVSNHNDIIMMFLALFSFFLLKKKRIVLATLFLMSSIFIKYATIFLLPVFIFAVYKTIRKENVDWNNIYYYSWISMFIIFLLSVLRVEIYPWYAIWFLTFTALIPQKKILLNVSLAFSFGLLLRYIPFMFLGTYFGIAPIIRTSVTFIPVFLVLIYGSFKKNYNG